MNFNSTSSKGYNSNYMLNDNLFSNDGIESGEIFEGTQTFHQLNQLSNQEQLLELRTAQERKEDETLAIQSRRKIKDQSYSNTLSEDEVREIVQQFNMSLNKHSLEKIELEKKVKELIEKLDLQSEVIIKSYLERENIIIENEGINLMIDQGQRTLRYLEKERSQYLNFRKDGSSKDQNKQVHESNNSSQIDKIQQEPIQTTLDQVQANKENIFVLAISDKIKQLQQQRSDLLLNNFSLRQDIQQSFQKDKIQEIKCLKCREFFIPLHNIEDSCQHHPGRLKFYSCRGCGANEYYSCCNRCKTCSKGCKKAKHIA